MRTIEDADHFGLTGMATRPKLDLCSGAKSRAVLIMPPDNSCERNIITIDAIHATQLLATTGFGSVIRSVDAGESWSLLSDGLEGVGGPVQLVIAPSGREFHAVFENGFIFHYSLVFPRRRAVAK